MNKLHNLLQKDVKAALFELYSLEVDAIDFQETRKEFEGDVTLVVFPYTRVSKKNPEQTAEDIGIFLLEKTSLVSAFQVVKGFLNLSINSAFWLREFEGILANPNFGYQTPKDDELAFMVEYSSPNTNKPLHLGHVRNNLLGYSISKIYEAVGRKVIKVQIINDRGIHICKSMLAWKLFGQGETPESTGMKGDHLVGKYYVAFDKAYKAEMEELMAAGHSKEDAAKNAPIINEAQKMLRAWEAGDPETIKLWKTMNNWVYSGFNQTYASMGVSFDKIYYESDTYILGKADVEKGLESGVFYRKNDGSIWIDLTADGLDEKLVLRSDGTSVYITQDIGTATQRFKDFNINALTYVVGNEQDYHFKVLFLILKKLGYPWAENLHHLSYGMVDLPTGKMKSREGTVVDADDLMADMIETAAQKSEELGKLEGFSDDYKAQLNRIIGMGALKYFILKVDPRKRMVFNPEESIDFNGHTGPFIQYTYARIQSLKRKAGQLPVVDVSSYHAVAEELTLIKEIIKFPEKIHEAAAEFNPSILANYAYDLVKTYNNFYQHHSILSNASLQVNAFRLALSSTVANVVEKSMNLLGIDCPDRM